MHSRFLRSFILWLLLGGLVSCGCMPAGGDPGAASTSAAAPPAVVMADFPGADAVDLTVAQDGTLYVALSMDESVAVVRSRDGGVTFTEPAPVSQEAHAFIHRIERPALATTLYWRASKSNTF